MQQPYQQHAGHDSLHGRPAVQCGAAAAPGSSRRQLGRAALRQRQPQQACTVVCSAANTLTGNGSLPLADKRILVTAPRQYATKLTTKLLETGARPLWLPTIQIAELQHEPSQQALLESLRDLSRYDHLAFSSKNGITAVLGALQSWLGTREAAVEHIERSGIKCWALGADAEVLLEAGVKEVHRPREPSTQGLVQELIRCGEAQEKRVLCPVPRVLRPLVEPDVVPRFLTSLAQAGAEAVRVDAYETGVGCMPATCAAEWELLMEGELHAIAFSSTAEAQGLVHLMGGVGFVHQAVRAHSVVLAAHGPYTAAGAASVLGVPVTCVSRDSSTFDGLVEALSNTIGGVPTPRQQWQMTEGAKLLRRAQQQGGAVLPAGPSFDEAWKEDAPPEVWPA